jgi:hypothetical protein
VLIYDLLSYVLLFLFLEEIAVETIFKPVSRFLAFNSACKVTTFFPNGKTFKQFLTAISIPYALCFFRVRNFGLKGGKRAYKSRITGVPYFLTRKIWNDVINCVILHAEL